MWGSQDSGTMFAVTGMCSRQRKRWYTKVFKFELVVKSAQILAWIQGIHSHNSVCQNSVSILSPTKQRRPASLPGTDIQPSVILKLSLEVYSVHGPYSRRAPKHED
jgi:hypothetical protein